MEASNVPELRPGHLVLFSASEPAQWKIDTPMAAYGLSFYILVAISSTESRGLGPQKPSILESQFETQSCYRIKDHGLATTQASSILIIFGPILVGPWFCRLVK